MPTCQDVSLLTADGVRLVADFRPGLEPSVAVVLAHGFTGSARTPALRRIADGLVAAGFPVLALDFRGHGRSGGRSTVGDLEIADLAAGVAWLRRQGYARVAVAGWSMGGSVVLRYAGLGGDADAVISVSSPGTWFERGTPPMRLVHWLCETGTGRLACRVLRRTRLAPDGWAVVPEAPEAVAGRIAPTPLLIVHGDADPYFPLHHLQALAAAAPTATVWLEEGMGHAETATTPALVERLGAWLRSVVHQPVCDDGRRD